MWGKGFGAEGDGGFAYYDLLAELGLWVELIEAPAVRHPPERVYPQ
jgi:methylmalonyl-CoA/ethylmalonyl-CoA epimerase